MNRQEAYDLLTKYLHNKNLLKHSLAAEVAMKEIYKKLYSEKSSYAEATADKWGITGLLHDVDYELAQETNQLDKHGLLIFEKESVIPEDIAHAIKSHNYQNTKVMPENDMDWAIVASDQLTGLIVAAALVHPDRKLAPLTADFVLNRMKSSSFAKGADRESIKMCESKLNIPLPEFVEVVLAAMKTINNELGL